jgi:hypothetical protein
MDVLYSLANLWFACSLLVFFGRWLAQQGNAVSVRLVAVSLGMGAVYVGLLVAAVAIVEHAPLGVVELVVFAALAIVLGLARVGIRRWRGRERIVAADPCPPLIDGHPVAPRMQTPRPRRTGERP